MVNNYELKEIPKNPYSKNKYQYLDHLEAAIDIKENYLEFYTELFCVNNYKLPPGCLVGTLEIPYQQIKDITFFLATDQERAKQIEHNKDYCKIFSSRFNVDISSNQFFKQELNNTKINSSIRLEIDPQVLKEAGVKLDQEPLDTLITETAEQKWDFSLFYSNTYMVLENSKVGNINGYSLQKDHECSSKVSFVEVESNSYKENISSINELLSIKSITPFQILSAKVKFNYWLEDSPELKTLETNLLLDRKIVNYQTINLDLSTSYDFTNNKVVLDTGGILGFYIPKYSHGYYKVELIMNQLNNLTKWIIRNDFVFLNNINNPHITLSKIRIDSLEGFERIKWNG